MSPSQSEGFSEPGPPYTAEFNAAVAVSLSLTIPSPHITRITLKTGNVRNTLYSADPPVIGRTMIELNDPLIVDIMSVLVSDVRSWLDLPMTAPPKPTV